MPRRRASDLRLGLAAFCAAVEAERGAPPALGLAAAALSGALGCAVAITERDASGCASVRGQAQADGLPAAALGHPLLDYAAERLARRARALSLRRDGTPPAADLPPGAHYLGIPAPRAAGAVCALHLLSSSAFTPAQRRVALAAADCLGARAAAGAGCGPRVSDHDASPGGAALGAGDVAVEQLLSDAVRTAADTLAADTCSLMLIEQAGSEPVMEMAHGLGEEALRGSPTPAGHSIASYVLSCGQPVILGNPLRDPRLQGLDIEPRRDIRSSICVPIALSEGVRGVVNFNRTESAEPFGHSDLRLGCMLAPALGRCAADARACRREGMSAREAAVARERLRRDLDHLYRLCDIVHRVNTSYEPRSILEQTAQGLALLVGGRGAGFAPCDEALSVAIGPASHSGVARLSLSAAAAEAAQGLAGPLVLDHRLRCPIPEAAGVAAEIGEQVNAGPVLVLPCGDARGSLSLIAVWGFAQAPGEAELSLAASLCSHSAALLRKAIDYEAAVSRRSLELSALYQLCGEIGAATTVESALRSVLEIAHSMVPYAEGLVFIRNEETSHLELAACRGVEFEATRAQAPQEQPGNMYQWVVAEGKAFISSDVGQHRHDASRLGQVLHSSMAVPLVVGNETIGALAIHSPLPRAYTEEHVKVLSIVASQAAAIYRALESLGRLSRYTDKILQSIVAGVVGLDRAGKVVIWSPAAARIFGREAAAAVGADFSTVAREIAGDGGRAQDGAQSLGLVALQVLAHGEPVLEHEVRLERAGRPPRALLADCTPLRDADGQLVGAVILVEDITERKHMQERMRQMSQLAAVGHVAANVAHEIRNPLSAIKTAAQFLNTEYSADQLIAQFSGIINQECDRLSKVATDFLTFARPSEPQLQRISLASVVNDALAATAREMAEHRVGVSWCAPPRLPRIWADPDALRQMLVNLLINAAQAIGSDGEITISLQAARTERGARAQQVVISDTGPGIGEEDLERIWTPFFSTKAKGTGLGLSIVRKIAEAHGGRVWAEGAAGGAVFVVRLPGERRDRRPTAARSAPQAPADAAGAWRKLDLYRDYAAALTTTAAEGDD